jgi:hypothetical protein
MYINAALYVMLGGFGKSLWANPYLNPFVFGFNLDSVLNDVGMLLACGVIKKISCEAVTARLSTAKVDLAVAPVFDSKAYDEDGKSDSDSDEMYMVGCRA